MTTELATSISYISGFIVLIMFALWGIFSYQAIMRLDSHEEEKKQLKCLLEQDDVSTALDILNKPQKKNLVDAVIKIIGIED